MATVTRQPGETELLLTRGAQVLWAEGNPGESHAFFDRAFRLAYEARNWPAVAQAALGLGGLWLNEHASAGAGEQTDARMRLALAMVGKQTPLGIRLSNRLNAAADYQEGTHASSLAALDQARRQGDAVILAEALSAAHQCLLGPDHSVQRSALSLELITGALATGRRGELLLGLLWRSGDLLMAADPHAERCLAELRLMLAEKDHAAIGYAVRTIDVMLAIRAGQFDRAEPMAAGCAGQGRAAGDADAAFTHVAHLIGIRWYQGRIAEMQPVLQQLLGAAQGDSASPPYQAALAVAAATAGDRRLATDVLSNLSDAGLERIRRSGAWLLTMHGIAEAAFQLGDAAAARSVYDLLAPYGHLPMTAGRGVVCFGSAHHALGVASMTLGKVEQAIVHLRTAVRDNQAIGHFPAAALSRARLAQALSRSSQRDEQSDAEREVRLAILDAAELGMVLPDASVTGKAKTAGRRMKVQRRQAACKHQGRLWRVELGQRAAVVEDSLGMNYLAALLANPGSEIAATELVTAGEPEAHESVHSASPKALAEVDKQMVKDYAQRLLELESDIYESESMNDLRRSERIRAQREWLVSEVASAMGLKSRVQHFSGNAERARISVGKALRRALDRVASMDPLLGEELRSTVKIGGRCSYHPN